MSRRPPRSTRTDTLFPYTTLFRSQRSDCRALGVVETAFGADQDRRRAGARTHRLQRGLAAGFVGEEQGAVGGPVCEQPVERHRVGSEEHTSELQSLMRNSYADFCLKTKNKSNLLIQRVHSKIKTDQQPKEI